MTLEMDYLDQPVLIHEEQGLMRATLSSNDEDYPVELPFKIEGDNLIIDCSSVKDVWEEQMKDDLMTAIDTHFNRHFFLSHKDLNLKTTGL